MDYNAPLNTTPTEINPRPAYFDGDVQTGQEGSYPPGRSIEFPQREILAVIEAAGLTPSNSDLTQLLQAIQTIAAGVGGDAAVFGLNPVYPQVTVNGGVMSIAASSGQVIVATGQTFIWRGGVSYTTTDFNLAARTFALVASKTYHLRWRYNGGSPVLVCIDTADPTYNPAAKVESHADFDTTFDDMLIARVVTNGANSPTVTALKNLARLSAAPEKLTVEYNVSDSFIMSQRLTGALNWARTPLSAVTSLYNAATDQLDAIYVIENAVTRYGYDAISFGYSGNTGQYYSSGRIKLAIWAN